MAVAFFFSHRKSHHHLPHRDDVPTGADNKLQPGFSALETTYIVQYLDKVFSWIYGAVLVFYFSFVWYLGWAGLFYSFCNRIPTIFFFYYYFGRGEGFSCYQAAVIGWGGVFKGVPGEGRYDMALESLYKSLTYFFTLFSFVLYIYRGVTNYGGRCKCFEPFAWREILW